MEKCYAHEVIHDIDSENVFVFYNQQFHQVIMFVGTVCNWHGECDCSLQYEGCTDHDYAIAFWNQERSQIGVITLKPYDTMMIKE